MHFVVLKFILIFQWKLYFLSMIFYEITKVLLYLCIKNIKCVVHLIFVEDNVKPVYLLQNPGKPFPDEIRSDSVSLVWNHVEKVDSYQVRFKSLGCAKWKLADTDFNQTRLTINGLEANTSYKFQVRGCFQDSEGPYGPVSDDIVTKKSLASSLLEYSKLLNLGHPSKYRLPVKENIRARNETARTRQLIIGNGYFFSYF